MASARMNLVLAEDAIRSAIRDYKSKRSKLQPEGSTFIGVSQNATTSETISTAPQN